MGRSSGERAPQGVRPATEWDSGVRTAATKILADDARALRDEAARLRLLLVEDSVDDAELVLLELRQAGYRPEAKRVACRADFVVALGAAPWDVIVSDHAMPGYGGLSALADLRRSGLDVPFILVSGRVGEAVAVEAMRAGAQDYVLKQDLTRLPAAIARELRERAARADQARMRERLLISERMASAGLLAAGVAHEINNPLAVAVSNVDFVIGGLRALQADVRAMAATTPDGARGWPGWKRFDQLKEALCDADDGLQRVRDIVVDVKLFSRPQESDAGTFDLRKVCDSSARLACNEIRHRARLEKRYEDVPPIEANESRAGQVVLNLIVNAVQALPEGRADVNEVRIATFTDEAGWAVVTVSDNGHGIEPRDLERIFEPFYTTKPVGIGTGLGLAVCRSIMNDLGGRIDVESRVGEGTTFRVAFPPVRDQRAAAQRAALARAPQRRARVLMVDDDVAMGAAAQRTLSAHHDVVFVGSAREAIARIERGERFDVILSDFMMPETSGMDLHRHLQKIAPELAERVVFLTGGAFTPAGRDYLDGVANRVVEKPFRAVDLLAVIGAVVGEGRERAP